MIDEIPSLMDFWQNWFGIWLAIISIVVILNKNLKIRSKSKSKRYKKNSSANFDQIINVRTALIHSEKKEKEKSQIFLNNVRSNQNAAKSIDNEYIWLLSVVSQLINEPKTLKDVKTVYNSHELEYIANELNKRNYSGTYNEIVRELKNSAYSKKKRFGY